MFALGFLGPPSPTAAFSPRSVTESDLLTGSKLLTQQLQQQK